MFRSLDNPRRRPVTIKIDRREYIAQAGETVAAAMLRAGVESCRITAVNALPRAPYCMMGICFDCLVMIDGLPDQQACMTAVREGMHIERQSGAGGIFGAGTTAVVNES